LSPSEQSLAITPLQRLLNSRERLRGALVARAADKAAPAGKPAFPWRDTLMSMPGASIVKEALSSWWGQHPMRVATLVAAEAGNALIKPTARKHPVVLVAGALLFGAALVWIKPWRWRLRKTLLAGLLPQLVSKAVAEIPVTSWLAVVSQLASEQQQKHTLEKTRERAQETAQEKAQESEHRTPHENMPDPAPTHGAAPY
jgi:hypothetical protein